MKNNQLDNFESLIKSSLDKQRAVYDSSDWDKLNKKLDQANKPFYSSPWFIAASVAAVLGIVYLLSTFNTVTEPTPLVIPQQENEIPDLLTKVKDESTVAIPLTEEEHNEIKEVFINADKEINSKEETNRKEEIKKSNSETIASDNKEVKSQNPEDTTISEENGFTPLDDEASTEENLILEEVVVIQKAAFHMNTIECCEGTTIDFVAEKQNNIDYLWSFDDGNYSKNENPSHLFVSPGSYKISLIVRSKIDNSIMTRSNDQLLIVHAKPNVDFDWEMNEENGIPYTSFINLTNKGTSWSWNFGDGSTSIEKDPNHTYRKKGQYLVTLKGVSSESCTNTINQDILIDKDYNLLAPNSFTPNGDGINDYFLPAALNRLNGSFTMTVYSQTEGLIYDTKNIDQPWDGTNQKAGTKCTEGSYVWVVKLTNEKGQSEQYKGAVLLLK
jgi:gliding motility-associated-like protein